MKANFFFLFTRSYPLLAFLPIAGFIVLGLTFRAQSIRDKPPAAATVMQRPVFEGVIEPILRRLCLDCHGAEKQRSQLRLDSFEACLQGGKNGRIIKPGQAKESSLIQRLQSSLDADGHMPPEDQPQPTAEEIALLEWWINAGAPANTKVCDMELAPKIDHFLKVARKRIVHE